MKTISFDNIFTQTKELCHALKITAPSKKRFVKEPASVCMDIMSFVTNYEVSPVLKNRALFVAQDIARFAEVH